MKLAIDNFLWKKKSQLWSFSNLQSYNITIQGKWGSCFTFNTTTEKQMYQFCGWWVMKKLISIRWSLLVTHTTWLSCHIFPLLPHTNLCCTSVTDTPHPMMQPSLTPYSHLVPHSLFQTLTSLTTHQWNTAAQRSLQNEKTEDCLTNRNNRWFLWLEKNRMRPVSSACSRAFTFICQEFYNVALFSFLSLQNSCTALWELWVWGLMTARTTCTRNL